MRRSVGVQPGHFIVIAVDAIDHSQIAQGGLDLTHADFEFWGGSGDVDNPRVPNMIDTLSLGGNVLGHGPVFQNLGSVAVLARPYELSTIERRFSPGGSAYGLISADLVLDVVSLWPKAVSPYPRCNQLVNARFDRMSNDRRGRDENVEFLHSLSRRTITAPGGALKLEWTRNSDADFARTLRSPGTIANAHP